MSNLINTEIREGFTVKFFAEDEYMTLDQMHVEADDIAEISAQLDNGDLVLFSAKVTASRNGIELASAYLGGCIYKDEQEFVNNSGYYGDMVEAVIEDAKQAIEDLIKGDDENV